MALIELKNIRKVYDQDSEEPTIALDGVNLAINKGEFVAIMGPSGSGKSTMLHVLGFLDPPTSGDYFFNGKLLNQYSKEEVARVRNQKMGFVFQAFNLLPRTSVLENVKLPLLYSIVKEAEWESRAITAIEAVGLGHRINHDSSQLSGGEKQRVAIARALINNPEVIFADEPTGNLDSKAGQAVMDIIRRLNEEMGHTVILVTHETYTAEHAQRIIRMKDGSVEKDEKTTHRRHANEFIK